MDTIQTFRIMKDIDDLEANDLFTMNNSVLPRFSKGQGAI